MLGAFNVPEAGTTCASGVSTLKARDGCVVLLFEDCRRS